MKWYQTETMSRPHARIEETLSLVDFWIDDARSRRQIITLELESSEAPGLPSDRAFTLEAIETEHLCAGACHLILPLDVGLVSPAKLLAFANDLFAIDGFTYGIGGFAINWNPRMKAATLVKNEFPYLAKRYPGIDIPYLIATLLTVNQGIKSINWLTMLSKELWGSLELSEISSIRSSPSVKIHGIAAGGSIIQAGPRPLLGDTYSRETMTDYLVVGRALSSIRCRTHPAIIPGDDEFTSIARTEEWLARFDG
ncbi:type VI immunity family protein [Nitrosospira lacus]|uniref:type VI immunity family protein n=1 Tax=Nitrosospira lacus TaxID=1288494 RepID=UPI0013747C91|nr:type VI immunity family protein [Nitrosospira lacus]